jgi:Zn finger protein HypA/HybF involved in hydrogenase expression
MKALIIMFIVAGHTGLVLASSPIRCFGDDVFFFHEREQLGDRGKGEAVDELACAQGTDAHLEKAFIRGDENLAAHYAAVRHVPSYSTAQKMKAVDPEFYSLVLPMMLVFAFFVIIGGALLLSIVFRKKTMPSTLAQCPSCDTNVPLQSDSVHGNTVFCPVCGQSAFRIETGRNGEIHVQVELLSHNFKNKSQA